MLIWALHIYVRAHFRFFGACQLFCELGDSSIVFSLFEIENLRNVQLYNILNLGSFTDLASFSFFSPFSFPPPPPFFLFSPLPTTTIIPANILALQCVVFVKHVCWWHVCWRMWTEFWCFCFVNSSQWVLIFSQRSVIGLSSVVCCLSVW